MVALLAPFFISFKCGLDVFYSVQRRARWQQQLLNWSSHYGFTYFIITSPLSLRYVTLQTCQELGTLSFQSSVPSHRDCTSKWHANLYLLIKYGVFLPVRRTFCEKTLVFSLINPRSSIKCPLLPLSLLGFGPSPVVVVSRAGRWVVFGVQLQ